MKHVRSHFSAQQRPTTRKVATLLGRAGAVLALTTGVLFLGAQVASANPNGTLYVNTNGTDSGTCHLQAHACLTINYALTQAAPGATIKVAAGNYAEQITISESISIVGASAASTIIEPTTVTANDTDTDSSTPQYAIVDVAPQTTSVSLSKLTINGSVAGPNLNVGCNEDFVGVYYHDATGSLTKVDVTGIQQSEADFGCQPGATGVYVATDSGSAVSSDVSMTTVKVTSYEKNGITCDDPATSCSITTSTVTGSGPIPTNSNPWENTAQNGIQIFGASASVTATTVSGDSYTNPNAPSGLTSATGILVINAGTLMLSSDHVTASDDDIYALWDTAFGLNPPTQGTWTISDNVASNAVNSSGTSGGQPVPFGDGFGDGIDVDSANGVTVSSNTTSHDAEYGIALYGATGSTVTDNTGVTDGDGMYLGSGTVNSASSGNTVSGNTFSTAIYDGILADVATSGNNFNGNTLTRNVEWDIQDNSSGGGTSGTANTWASNTCHPAGDSNVVGLCG